MLGCNRDSPDYRDYTYQDSPISCRPQRFGLNGSIDYRQYDVLRVQIGNSCVGHALAGSAAICAAIAGRPIRFPSPLLPYTGSRMLDRADPSEILLDKGCSIREAMSWCSSRGMVEESVWPETAESVNSIPPLDVLSTQEEAKLEAYYLIYGNVAEGMMSALSRGHCPIFGMVVDRKYSDLRSAVYESPGGTLMGGHAQVVVGYLSILGAFVVRNTWGYSWGDGGYGLIDENLMNTIAYNVWVIQVTPWI